tara:strand:- start:186 stop:542 length:357 start_codon:yes stop_codon:yes gene_type:complete
LRTIVYVDGYNLFYSLLKNSNYKWLDLYSLFQKQILHTQDPNTDLICIKYYTANIKAKFASHGALASEAQQRYHRALESPHTGEEVWVKLAEQRFNQLETGEVNGVSWGEIKKGIRGG